MIGIECLIDLIRKNLHRNGHIRKRIVPKHGFHVIHRFNLLSQLCHIFLRHILHNNKGKSTFSEILKQLLLPLDRVHIPRQVIQHVVIDPCPDHAEHSGNHQHGSQNQNEHAVFDYRF